jgi:hypothetical protein
MLSNVLKLPRFIALLAILINLLASAEDSSAEGRCPKGKVPLFWENGAFSDCRRIVCDGDLTYNDDPFARRDAHKYNLTCPPGTRYQYEY